MWQLPILRWAPEWREAGTLRADVLAGLTSAVVVLPQGLAFATLAGLPPHHGLYAAMLPCLVAALFGSSRLMVTGPANAISLTTMALIAPLAAVGSTQYVGYVLALSLLVGVMQVLLGLARAGALVDKVPHAVVVGFTAGAGILIMNSQLGTVLGLALPRGLSVADNLLLAWQQREQFQPAALVVALTTIGVSLAAQPINRWVPAMLVALVAGALAALALQHGVPQWPALAVVPALPGAWPPFTPPQLDLDTLRLLFGATLVMTLLALTEASAIARSMARRRGDALDGNQEFVAQGLANITGAFFSAMPSSGSFNRSALNAEAGARTPLAAASAAVFLLIILAAVAPMARWLPLVVVAALLFVVAVRLINVPEIKHHWHEGWADRVPLVVTLVATITLSLEWAILLGIASAFIAQRVWPTPSSIDS